MNLHIPGTRLEPNTTALPNLILDELMPQLDGAEEKVVRVVCRQTYGWHKPSDKISNSQMMAKTGLGESAFERAVRSLAKRKIIIRHIGIGRTMTEYSLNYNHQEWEGVILAPSKKTPSDPVKKPPSEGVKSTDNKINHQNKLSKEISASGIVKPKSEKETVEYIANELMSNGIDLDKDWDKWEKQVSELLKQQGCLYSPRQLYRMNLEIAKSLNAKVDSSQDGRAVA